MNQQEGMKKYIAGYLPLLFVLLLFLWNITEASKHEQSTSDNIDEDGDDYETSFFSERSRHRSGGIDVSKHSKTRRKLWWKHTHEPTRSPLEEDTTSEIDKKVQETEESETKPVIKIGIVFPRQIFQQRKYQTIIRNSLSEIAQEKCHHGDDHQVSDKRGTRNGIRFRRQKRARVSSSWSRRNFNLGLKGNVSSVFRSAKNSILMRKTPERRRQMSTSKSVLEHVKEKYNFVWNSATFRLEDETDSVNFGDLVVSPPPSDITDLLCQHISNGSVAIIYFTNTEKFGRSTAASQYFLQMAGFLGIPVIAWNADNAGLESRSTSHLGSEVTGHLQLAPSVEHQISAMLSILDRYNWRQFGIVTSEIAGHDDFVQAVRDGVNAKARSGRSRYNIQAVFKVTEANGWDLKHLAASEVRIIILYCTQSEASMILEAAEKFGLTSNKYLWLVTQSVIGVSGDRSVNRRSLPVGMLGIHFEVDMMKVLQPFVSLGLRTLFHAVDTILHNEEAASTSEDVTQASLSQPQFNFSLNCQGVDSNHRWEGGPTFYRQLLNTTLTMKRMKSQRVPIFNSDGTVKETELKIMNFRPIGTNKDGETDFLNKQWEEVGTWNTWNGLDIKDIVWPGGSHVPPQGVPEKFHIRITFLEEPPFIIISDPDPISNKCSMNRGVPCYMSDRIMLSDANKTEAKCCSGLCIDLLTKVEEELGFTYELVRTPDPKWGTFEHGSWNGLMAELVNKRTDLVLSALKINAEREAVVDFTTPFLESGIAIIVAKRTGIISPTAFLEPFDKASWMLIALVAIQASTFSIFLFEWMSPSGYDMKITPSKSGHKFSLFRTYWLVMAVLFQASVSVDCPRGLTARFMSSIWALFAVVFLALYTANLAAFMIPRKEYHNLKGVEDEKIANPYSQKPSLKFCTVPYSYTQVTLKKNFPGMYNYMKQFNTRNTTSEAIKAVKEGHLDAFIYDGTVLNYLASQDDECRLIQVGSWTRMTGYALAFPLHSKYKNMFDSKILELRENGDLERLSRFWMIGTCKPNVQEKRASEPLSIAQFTSAFLLLLIGLGISMILLILEHLYMKHLQKHVQNSNSNGCCALVSRSIGSKPSKEHPDDDLLYNDEANYLNHKCGKESCKDELFQLTAQLACAQEEINFLEGLLGRASSAKKNEDLGIATAAEINTHHQHHQFHPGGGGSLATTLKRNQHPPMMVHQKAVSEFDQDLISDSVSAAAGGGHLTLQRRRRSQPSSDTDIEEKETVL